MAKQKKKVNHSDFWSNALAEFWRSATTDSISMQKVEKQCREIHDEVLHKMNMLDGICRTHSIQFGWR